MNQFPSFPWTCRFKFTRHFLASSQSSSTNQCPPSLVIQHSHFHHPYPASPAILLSMEAICRWWVVYRRLRRAQSASWLDFNLVSPLHLRAGPLKLGFGCNRWCTELVYVNSIAAFPLHLLRHLKFAFHSNWCDLSCVRGTGLVFLNFVVFNSHP